MDLTEKTDFIITSDALYTKRITYSCGGKLKRIELFLVCVVKVCAVSCVAGVCDRRHRNAAFEILLPSV